MPQGVSIFVNGHPDDELSAGSVVEVVEQVGSATSYRLAYTNPISEEGDLPMLTDTRLDPGVELMVVVESREGQECLVKGPVVGESVRLEHGGRASSVDVHGMDSSIAMDRETKATVWADLTDSDVATAVLASHGYLPDTEATDARHETLKHPLLQRDTDLRLLRRLARRNGFLFWVTSDVLGVETAHFKRPPLQGQPSADLTLNQDMPSIRTLDIHWEVERPSGVVGDQLALNSKSTMDGSVQESSMEPLGAQPFSRIVGEPRLAHIVAPVDDVGDLRARGEGLLMESSWFVRASTQTTLATLGTVVRAHAIVNLGGAGSRHSGLYFVTKVRHTIDSAAHRMDIELARNAWGS